MFCRFQQQLTWLYREAQSFILFRLPKSRAHVLRRIGSAHCLLVRVDPRGARIMFPPVSLLSIRAGTKLMLPSLNGSRLSVVAGRTTGRIPVLTGCLRNARAVAVVARAIAGKKAIGVVPAGERWPDGSLRPAVEDLLGA